MIKHIVALSGGKDSTAMALRLKELNPEVEYEFVCTPTGDELPPMMDHWKKLSGILGPIKKLSTLSLSELIKQQKMIPNFRARFCTRIIKIEPFFQYMESLPSGSIMYVGIRADEDDRIGMMLDQDDKFEIRRPFVEWMWGMQEVQDYLKCRGIEIPKRTDCGSCFYQRLSEWKDLLQEYPDRYEQYVQIEESIGHTFRSNGRDTWPAALKDLRNEFKNGRKLVHRQKKSDSLAQCPWCSK